ncbi:hypothetical protein Pan241w_20550 [Gimesia alba]|uniref:Uncharacterized protein n=1 Tax=Gimesia alba TaxID=2527973 RepID=A0A517RDL3_9PLAN|nr:hypothetical protein [Gimesia alba]QDT41975.1 hypothetical protein Pan241w_20550 [Gimesia alba]
MQQFRLKCPCGYESNLAPFGSDAWSSSYFVPVVLSDDEVLHRVEIKKRADEPEEDFDERLDEAIQTQALDEFGENATIMTPLAIRGDQTVKCPRCGRQEAKFQFVGF